MMSKNSKKGFLFLGRAIFTALLGFAIYLITGFISMPSLLGLGEERVFMVVFLARIAEETFYRLALESLKQEFIIEKKRSIEANQ